MTDWKNRLTCSLRKISRASLPNTCWIGLEYFQHQILEGTRKWLDFDYPETKIEWGAKDGKILVLTWIHSKDRVDQIDGTTHELQDRMFLIEVSIWLRSLSLCLIRLEQTWIIMESIQHSKLKHIWRVRSGNITKKSNEQFSHSFQLAKEGIQHQWQYWRFITNWYSSLFNNRGEFGEAFLAPLIL